MRSPSPIGKALRVGLLVLVMLWSGFPIFLVVISSFKSGHEIFTVPPSFLFEPTFEHYRNLWRLWPQFFDNMWNSLVVTLGATALTVMISVLAGYAYSRARGKLLQFSAFFLVFIKMLPPIIVIIPLFPLMNALNLNDTYILLILLYSAFFVSLSTWIMKAFIDNIPIELEESARIDGAGTLQILRRIVMPLSASGMIAASIFILVFSWNEFIFALVFSTRNAKTTPLVLSEMLGTVEGVDWGVLFAASTVQLLPVLIFVIAVQRYVVAGLTAGAVKG